MIIICEKVVCQALLKSNSKNNERVEKYRQNWAAWDSNPELIG